MGPRGGISVLDNDVDLEVQDVTLAGTTESEVLSVAAGIAAFPRVGNARNAGDFHFVFEVREAGVNTWTTQTYTVTVVAIGGTTPFAFSFSLLAPTTPDAGAIEGATIEISSGPSTIFDVMSILVVRD